MLSIDWSLFPGVSVSGEPLRHARLFLLCPRMPPTSPSVLGRGSPAHRTQTIGSKVLRPAHVSLCLVRGAVNQSTSRVLRLGVRWNSLWGEKKGRENLVRLNFLSRFTIIYEYFLQRTLLTPGACTFQDEEPQVSIKKARSNYHSKLITLVFFRGNYSKFC